MLPPISDIDASGEDIGEAELQWTTTDEGVAR